MSTSDEPDLWDESNPLLRPLDESEYALLEVIWQPARTPYGWPMWDYVSRTMCQRDPAVIDADQLFRALPAISRELQLGQYGLVWSSDSYALNPGSFVGLTIAGLLRLSERIPGVGACADEMAVLLRHLADEERAIAPNPAAVANVSYSMNASLAAITARSPGRPAPLPADAIKGLLQKEYPILSFDASQSGEYIVRLSPLLRHFLNVESARDYVDAIGRSSPARVSPPVSEPAALPRVLDHLSYVLRSDKSWSGDPLVMSPDLESPATLTEPAQTAVDFRDRMSALARVVENLNVPNVPDDALQKFDNKQPRSIGRLEEWLHGRLLDEESIKRVDDAIKVLRAANRLRVEGQHMNANAQRQAARARVLLGLPDPIREYGTAWDVIRARVSDAFEVIRHEVQLAQSR